MKKAIALFLAATMLLGVFSACGKKDPEDDVVAGGHLNLTFTVDDILNYDDEFGKMLQEKFDVTLTAKPGESEESLGLWASAQELPHLWTSVSFEDAYRFYSWIDQGITRDIPYDMISKYPNVKKLVDESVEVNAIKEMKDGKIWFIPRPFDAHFDYQEVDGGRIFYREDVVNALGLTLPTTIDEFMQFWYDMSHSGVEGEPTTGLLNGPGYIYYMYGVDAEGWVKEGDQWIPGYMSDTMIEPLKAMQQLFKDGSLDNEWMITSNNDLYAKWGNKVGGGMIRNGGDAYWYMRAHRSPAEAINPDFNTRSFEAKHQVEIMPVPKAADGQSHWMPFLDAGSVEINASTTDEELDRILAIIDWTLTEEALHYSTYGIEGVTYTVNEDGTYSHIYKEDGTEVTVLETMPSAFVVNMCNWGLARTFFVDSKWTAPETDPAEQERLAGLKSLDDECLKWTQVYDQYVVPSADATIARILTTPAKDDYYAGFEWQPELDAIIAGSEPVETAFAAFKVKCLAKDMQKAIDEVTAFMAGIGK